MRTQGRYGHRIPAVGADGGKIVLLNAFGDGALIAADSLLIDKICQEQAPAQQRGNNDKPQRAAKTLPTFAYSDSARARHRCGHSKTGYPSPPASPANILWSWLIPKSFRAGKAASGLSFESFAIGGIYR